MQYKDTGELIGLILAQMDWKCIVGVTLIAIGPLTNIAAALERCPEIATYTRYYNYTNVNRNLLQIIGLWECKEVYTKVI